MSSTSKVLGMIGSMSAILLKATMHYDSSDKAQLQHQQYHSDKDLQIFLVGKTGAGKSATGNTILGRKAFQSEMSSSSVTRDGEKDYTTLYGRKVTVIDSPGLFDTSLDEEEVIERIKRCIALSAPGVHVFLVVIRLGRMTKEEEKAVQIIQKVFGNEASKYTMVLFTHGDELENKSIHTFVRHSPQLLSFIKTCSGRYHVFNNKEKNQDQVTQLLDQIDKMVTVNGGSCYTSNMLKAAEKVIEEKKQGILKEKEKQIHKEIEATRVKAKAQDFEKIKQSINEKYQINARRDAEKSPNVYNMIMSALGKAAIEVILRLYFGR